MRLLLTPLLTSSLVSLVGCGSVRGEPACSATFTPCGGTTMIAGTYSTAGDNVALAPSGATVSTPSGYCVSGAQLLASLGTPGAASANAYFVFTKH